MSAFCPTIGDTLQSAARCHRRPIRAALHDARRLRETGVTPTESWLSNCDARSSARDASSYQLAGRRSDGKQQRRCAAIRLRYGIARPPAPGGGSSLRVSSLATEYPQPSDKPGRRAPAIGGCRTRARVPCLGLLTEELANLRQEIAHSITLLLSRALRELQRIISGTRSRPWTSGDACQLVRDRGLSSWYRLWLSLLRLS